MHENQFRSACADKRLFEPRQPVRRKADGRGVEEDQPPSGEVEIPVGRSEALFEQGAVGISHVVVSGDRIARNLQCLKGRIERLEFGSGSRGSCPRDGRGNRLPSR